MPRKENICLLFHGHNLNNVRQYKWILENNLEIIYVTSAVQILLILSQKTLEENLILGLWSKVKLCNLH